MKEILKKEIQICNLKCPANCDYQRANGVYYACGAIVGKGGDVSKCDYVEKVTLILRKDGEK